jgi:hypothetical protein
MQEALAAGTRLSPTAADLTSAAGTGTVPGKVPPALVPAWDAEGWSLGHIARAGDPLALGDAFATLANTDALAQAFALAAQRRR